MALSLTLDTFHVDYLVSICGLLRDHLSMSARYHLEDSKNQMSKTYLYYVCLL
jgi:hypothetical protein